MPPDVKNGRYVFIGVHQGFTDEGVNTGIRHDVKYCLRPAFRGTLLSSASVENGAVSQSYPKRVSK